MNHQDARRARPLVGDPNGGSAEASPAGPPMQKLDRAAAQQLRLTSGLQFELDLRALDRPLCKTRIGRPNEASMRSAARDASRSGPSMTA